MRRGFRRAVAGLLASTGLAACLSSLALAQARVALTPSSIQEHEPDSPVPGAPEGYAQRYPLPAVAEPMTGASQQSDWDNRFYANAEYLLWWFKDSPVPVPLLTTTSNPDAMPVAVLNDPNSTVLLGDQSL